MFCISPRCIAILVSAHQYVCMYVAGSRWVGWLNDSQDPEPLEIIFEFDGVREFSAMHLHTSHVVTRDVQVSRPTLLMNFKYSDDLFFTAVKEYLSFHASSANKCVVLFSNPKNYVGRYFNIYSLYYTHKLNNNLLGIFSFTFQAIVVTTTV